MNVVLPHRNERKKENPKRQRAREKAVISLVFVVVCVGEREDV